MNDSLVPPELLAALPLPWQFAHPNWQHTAVKELQPGPQERAVALSALQTGLAFQVDDFTRHGEDRDWGLPESFFGEYSFLMLTSLERCLPTLADVTHANVRDWAERNEAVATVFDATWTTPPDEVVEAVARMWADVTVARAVDALIRWLTSVARDHLDADERARLIDMLKAATPHLPWRETILTIIEIGSLSGRAERDYFERLANDPSLHEKTRAEAARECWIIDRKDTP